MTTTRDATLTRFDRLDACPRCGAHRWEQDRRLALEGLVRCGECLHTADWVLLAYPEIGGE